MEIKICQSEGIFLTSLLLAKYRNQGDLKLLDDYQFSIASKNEKIKQILLALESDRVDEEMLYNLATTYKTEFKEADFQELLKNKEINNLTEVRDLFLEALELFEAEVTAAEKDFFAQQTLDKVDQWVEKVPEIENKLWEINDFFKVEEVTPEVLIQAYSPFLKKESGMAIIKENEIIIKTSIENEKNIYHEYLHSIINPIVQKVSEDLSEKEKEEMLMSANYKLQQDYEDFNSVLAETLIRTYNDYYTLKQTYPDFYTFWEKVNELSEKEFQGKIVEGESLYQFCLEKNIKNKQDFSNYQEEYYEKYVYDGLGEKCFQIYQDYQMQEEPFSDYFHHKIVKEKSILM